MNKTNKTNKTSIIPNELMRDVMLTLGPKNLVSASVTSKRMKHIVESNNLLRARHINGTMLLNELKRKKKFIDAREKELNKVINKIDLYNRLKNNVNVAAHTNNVANNYSRKSKLEEARKRVEKPSKSTKGGKASQFKRSYTSEEKKYKNWLEKKSGEYALEMNLLEQKARRISNNLNMSTGNLWTIQSRLRS